MSAEAIGETGVAREHKLKCWPEPFQALWAGRKWFEFRRNDRGFRVGDVLRLAECEIVDDNAAYTGRVVYRVVTYVLGTGFGVPDGYVVMSLDSCEEPRAVLKARLEKAEFELAKAINLALDLGNNPKCGSCGDGSNAHVCPRDAKKIEADRDAEREHARELAVESAIRLDSARHLHDRVDGFMGQFRDGLTTEQLDVLGHILNEMTERATAEPPEAAVILTSEAKAVAFEEAAVIEAESCGAIKGPNWGAFIGRALELRGIRGPVGGADCLKNEAEGDKNAPA